MKQAILTLIANARNLSIQSKLLLVVAVVTAAFLTSNAISFFGRFSLKLIADNYAKNLSIYIPLNEGFITTLTYVIFFALVYLASYIFSADPSHRKLGVIAIAVAFLTYNIVIGVAMMDNRIHPISGKAMKCYVQLENTVKYFDLVEGNERKYDPVTGRPCIPITPELAEKLDKQEQQVLPRKIPANAEIDLFDRVFGTPVTWYYRNAFGKIELYDNAGFHPINGAKLQAVDEAIAQEWTTQREELLEQEKAKAEAEKRQAALEAKRQEEVRRRKQAEEAERRRLQQEAEEKRLAEEQEAEAKKLAEAEEKRERLAEVGDKCDQLAGNQFDRNRNDRFLSVPYSLLRSQAELAISICQKAAALFPETARYKYQYARALQANKNPHAKLVLQELVANYYPAAYDNLGWVNLNNKKYREGIALFKRGAELGSMEAMFSLASQFYEGIIVEKNLDSAYSLAKAAASQGHPDAQAMVLNLERQIQKEYLDAESKAMRQRRLDNIISGVLNSLLLRN